MAPVRVSRFSAWRLLLVLALPALAACATEYDRKAQEAEQLRIVAADAGAEWLQTEALLQQARQAKSDGDEASALEYIEKARFQAEAAIEQAEREADTWQHRVIR
jgi:hypothetical protein